MDLREIFRRITSGENESDENHPSADPSTLAISRLVRQIYLQRQIARVAERSTRAQNGLRQRSLEEAYLENMYDEEEELNQRIRRRPRRVSAEDEGASMQELQSDESDEEKPALDLQNQIKLDPKLPKSWKEIEEEQTQIAIEIYNMLGPLAVLLYKRLETFKIPKRQENMLFLKGILDYYERTFEKNPKQIKQLFQIAPKLREIRIGMKHRQQKENIVYKVLIDLLSHYLSHTNPPVYFNHLIPLAIDFYRSIDQNELYQIQSMLKSIASHDKSKIKLSQLNVVILIMNCISDYQDYYQYELIQYSNQIGGCERNLYIM